MNQTARFREVGAVAGIAALVLLAVTVSTPIVAQATMGGKPESRTAGADGAATKGSPKIEFDRELHDFGRAGSGEKLTTTFTVRNVGDADLIIGKLSGG
jgi:hypothetical protein